MPNTTRYAHSPYGHGHYGPDHCPGMCPNCGPDAGAWAVGELIVGTIVGVATALAWMVRHPATTLVLTIALVAVGLLTGEQLTGGR